MLRANAIPWLLADFDRADALVQARRDLDTASDQVPEPPADAS